MNERKRSVQTNLYWCSKIDLFKDLFHTLKCFLYNPIAYINFRVKDNAKEKDCGSVGNLRNSIELCQNDNMSERQSAYLYQLYK